MAARRYEWLKERSPGLYRFLTRDDRPFPFLREVLGIALVLFLLAVVLWGATGQSFPDAPVVVVESGSMMHCANGIGRYGAAELGSGDCEPMRYGRFGTIDPGDLIFVRNSDGSAIETFADGGRDRYGLPGDVIIYQKNGLPGTPIIHRAMFWIDITQEDGTTYFHALGQTVTDVSQIQFDSNEYRTTARCELRLPDNAGPEHSGYITKGDNNVCFDQGRNGGGHPQYPVQPAWILGQARGEVPWMGLIKLKVSDLGAGTSNYANAPSDVKTMMWVAIVVLVGAPFASEFVLRRMRGRRAEHQEGPDTPPPSEPEPGDEPRD